MYFLKHLLTNCKQNSLKYFLFKSSSRKFSNSKFSQFNLQSFTDGKNSYATSNLEGFCLLPDTLLDRLNKWALEKPSAISYAFPHNRGLNLTFKETQERVETMAKSLLNIGFQKGDRIALLIPNTHELVITFLAAASIGLISVLLNPGYQLVELEYMLKKTSAKGILIYDSFKTIQHLEIIRKLCPEINDCAAGELNSVKLPNLKHVIVLNSPLIEGKKEYKGTWTYEQLAESKVPQNKIEMPKVFMDDPCMILFTSGTTGFPKGALMTHHNLFNTANCASKMIDDDEGSKIVCSPIPLFHIFGFSVGIMTPLLIGSTSVLPFYLPDTLFTMKSIQGYKCTSLRGPPTIFTDMLNHPDRKKYDLSSLHSCLFGGSTVPPDLLIRLKSDLKLKNIIVGYGMTETSLCLSSNTSSDVNISHRCAYESIGRPFPHIEVKIVDPITQQIVPLNTDGELCLRGFNVMKEYWGEPEKTAESLDKNGWFRTGDIIQMDKDGFLYFKSRLKDVIIRGGANIYPAEVEAFLRTNPKIIDVAVFGVPDKRFGEEICAFVKTTPDSSFTLDELKSYCNGNIASFKIPKYMRVVENFILNATGKPLKNKMAELARKELNL